MKVKIGDTVGTIDFGVGPIVAMSAAWCVVKVDPKAKNGKGEIAVSWDQVFVPAEPGETGSSVEEKDIPGEEQRTSLFDTPSALRLLLAEALGHLGDGGGLASSDLIERAKIYLDEHPAGKPSIDYRALLKKYINLLGEEEGTTFLTQAQEPEFSLEEIAELAVLDRETSQSRDPRDEE